MKALFAPLLALAAVHTALSAGARDPQQDLVAELEGAIEAPGWEDDRWGVMVVSLDAGDTLFARGAEEALVPASNLKLFTTAAALYFLRPDYRYSTYLTATGPLRNGVVEGDLYVYGTGDPTLSDRFFEGKTAVWEALADSLAALGVRRIEGDIVGDASYFEGPAVGHGWELTYVTHTYAAPASGLAFNDNIVTLRVTPGPDAGAPAEIQLIPGGGVDLRNEATTVASGRSHIEVERLAYDAPIVVRGQVRSGSSALWRAVPVVDPARFAVSVFEPILEERGIEVVGTVRSVHDGARSPITGSRVFAPTLDEDGVVQVLAVHRSPPLLEILKVINQRSHNLYAESVLRTVGRVATGRGSVRGGRAAVAAILEEAGADASTVFMDDGSGLSTEDRASARSIVELLAFMARSPYGDEYMETLPEAATSRGLRRMQQTDAAGNLRAKTGTIDRVSALSGYVTARSGERLAFSIISNDVPSTWKAKRVEDRIGARLAAFDRPLPRRVADAAGRGTDPDSASGARTARADSALRMADATPADSPLPDAAPRPDYYTIKRGDTLEGIAREAGVSVGALRAANPGVNARRLIPGKRLKLPNT
ncbi:MAG: D-alanyl-D-alanine carboxypeptidase/D-alanyl-D-alanine-endopeptidase [Gemmatimonadetes bacterium]|nr:D-alanyl-D-alanine carboxypeptidase/D-alanyl-D-alanine-endopeptidase [Gemmatimonadota bacterium]NIQ57522.1 D-alanyl-D-alanine carboxypeptidase/D-alanyl-D-alanine-endopeptidase [Gemmatimonadota bacterium]NIU77680.1 D-alanyl-D-alanine carboxypeptidase/D-alanyl-D-alanine-endopeptidase [Gammaproteobacteria bacterium]NIX46846.1 D-alanyl-D-alanine carboxypeptidase/D-alanyl-D-alanine-endopeptidase [Gemmatimonadota bacterium]NIY11194.1 D-alanyl-D-alanine carboxypeptidase/D-alanyl-D-alanine-endopepti